MADRRKGKKRREEVPETTIAREEYAVAQYLRQHLPIKETKLYTHKVKYFVAAKAVDCLLDSPFAAKRDALFSNRESVVEYLDLLLFHKFFHRAKKISGGKEAKYVKEKKKEKAPKEDSSDEKDSKKKRKAEEKKKRDEEEKKRKKKLKLEMHLEQMFADGSDIYVWIYDPIPMKAWFIGGFVVIGVILLCLFPLWPPSVRKCVYYVSVAAAAFLVFILGLAVVRVIVFSIVWAATLGQHHLLLLPNLTEDVGFLDSFWPLYKYEYRGHGDKAAEDEGLDYTKDEPGKKKKKKKRLKETSDGNKGDGYESAQGAESDSES